MTMQFHSRSNMSAERRLQFSCDIVHRAIDQEQEKESP